MCAKDIFIIESSYESTTVIAGVDEVGRGSIAGPIVAAAVIVDRTKIFDEVQDSKRLSAKIRQNLYNKITEAYTYAIALISSSEIDKIGIQKSNIQVCTDAVINLRQRPDLALVDGNLKFNNCLFRSVVHGDKMSYSIAAASIVAKVYRDSLMKKYSEQYPMYGWNKNSGYGTAEHIEAIKKYGVTDLHRKSFKVKGLSICTRNN